MRFPPLSKFLFLSSKVRTKGLCPWHALGIKHNNIPGTGSLGSHTDQGHSSVANTLLCHQALPRHLHFFTSLVHRSHQLFCLSVNSHSLKLGWSSFYHLQRTRALNYMESPTVSPVLSPSTHHTGQGLQSSWKTFLWPKGANNQHCSKEYKVAVRALGLPT